MGRSRRLTKAERMALDRSAEAHQLRQRVLERRINTILKPFKKKLEKAQKLRDELQRSLQQHQGDVAEVAKACGVDVPIDSVRPVHDKKRRLIRFQWDDQPAAPRARDKTPEKVGQDLAKKAKKKGEKPEVERPLDDKPALPKPPEPQSEAPAAAPAPAPAPKAEEK